MRLATLANGTPDGQLVVVSEDGSRTLAADIPNLLAAIGTWKTAEPALRRVAAKVEAGQGLLLEPSKLRAPLPRTWQWLDGSAFGTHGQLMQVAFNLPSVENDRPLMYQGISDRFYGPNDPVLFPSETDGIDFEGEFGVIVDAVPMGITPSEAMKHIRLIVQINDWSLRTIAPIEMKTGFGWIQAKPACSVAPFAVTPEALGDAWRDGRVCMDLVIERNGKPFGRANGHAMDVGFHELIAHAARTRDLVAGTIIGSGTVSNSNYAEVGSSCISEVRAIETIRAGKPSTSFMAYGDTIRMEAITSDGQALFGAIEQRVAPPCAPERELAGDLGPVHRVVTGHDEAGQAVFRAEDSTAPVMIPSGDAAFLPIWATQTVPADNNDERDGRDLPTGLTLEGGSVIRVVDMMPGKQSPLHRTNSIDYGIVLKGEIELELEGGQRKTVREGGIIVQRGTNHLWRNNSDAVCRIVFVLIEAPAYVYDGQPLAELKPDSVESHN